MAERDGKKMQHRSKSFLKNTNDLFSWGSLKKINQSPLDEEVGDGKHKYVAENEELFRRDESG